MTQTDTWYAIAVLFFITTDYITGVIKAIIQGDLSSKRMREGLGHKLTYLMLALTAWFINTLNMHLPLGFPINVLTCTVSGICLIELTSIIENITAINPELKNAPFMNIFTQNTHDPKHKGE
nr:MAG: holin family protein [Bacteriophage sp.]